MERPTTKVISAGSRDEHLTPSMANQPILIWRRGSMHTTDQRHILAHTLKAQTLRTELLVIRGD